MQPLLVLFDIDGTLVNSAGAGRRALERALERVFGAQDVRALAAKVPFEGRTDPLIILDMARAAGIEDTQVERRAAELREEYVAALRAELSQPDARRHVLPGIVSLLEELRTRPAVHLGLLTGNIEAGARLKLEPFGLNRYFEDGGFSSDHPERSEIARLAHMKLSRRTGIAFTPERVVVVGDTDQDVACARANGFRAVVLESGFVSRARLEAARPDALLPDAKDLGRVLQALGLDQERS